MIQAVVVIYIAPNSSLNALNFGKSAGFTELEIVRHDMSKSPSVTGVAMRRVRASSIAAARSLPLLPRRFCSAMKRRIDIIAAAHTRRKGAKRRRGERREEKEG